MEALDLFKHGKTITRVLLPTPKSQRYVPQDMTELDRELEIDVKKEIYEGTDYVQKYVEEEESQFLEVSP